MKLVPFAATLGTIVRFVLAAARHVRTGFRIERTDNETFHGGGGAAHLRRNLAFLMREARELVEIDAYSNRENVWNISPASRSSSLLLISFHLV